ncbi:MAG: 7-cyano-7-deazaguanine synthase [Candidatus Atribacteria bacterium]|nr:7-cyano-7-deazaguanine synthase [Candidatus Atribacteria bacterium]
MNTISDSDQIQEIKNKIKQIASDDIVIVAFSGGLDSTVVLNLAKQALGNRKLIAVHVDFGHYTYNATKKNVKMISRMLNIKLHVISGQTEQMNIMRGGPDCNLCTRKVKLGLIRLFAGSKLILTGSNQSDSWGQYGLDYSEGFYAPLFNYSKSEIIKIAADLKIEIKRIGENSIREGCKLKHLLKPLVNPMYHGEAVHCANELLLREIHRSGLDEKIKIANVKIIGPLNKNIALVNIFPQPDRYWLKDVEEKIIKLKSIEECKIIDRPIELIVKANKGQYNNLRSRYWIEEGKLQPEFAFPIAIQWLLTTNHRLKTFQVVGYN